MKPSDPSRSRRRLFVPMLVSATAMLALVAHDYVAAANRPPNLILKTTPVADQRTTPYPTISGPAPLTVRFNLCTSDDPDFIFFPDGTQDPNGDTLNWQFHFGDTKIPAFNDDGTFNPDTDHVCRTEHTYREGSYIATLSVTDKHLEDQDRNVAALARSTTRVRINAGSAGGGDGPAGPPGVPVLYGATSGGTADLLIINPATGQATTVGPIGIGMTGMAVHPFTKVLYGTSAGVPGNVFTRDLYRIDPATGAGTLIGPIGLGFGGIADVAFDGSGVLYGWSESSDDLITLNLASGAGALIGNAGISTRGSGLEFMGGTLYLAGNNGNGPLRTVNPATGLTTPGPILTGAPLPTQPINALSLSPTGVLYGVNNTSSGGGGPTFLITINPATGAITTVGPTVNGLDAIAWYVP